MYASLWNKRAVEERSFARVDQSTVAMGLSVVPAYDSDSEVAANAVVVTRVLNAEGLYGYSLSVQDGNNLVTNPDPGTYSETTIAAFISDDEPTSLTVTRFAKPAASLPQRSEPVLRRDAMIEIVELAKQVDAPTAGPNRATTLRITPRASGFYQPRTRRHPSILRSRSWRTASSCTSRSASSRGSDTRHQPEPGPPTKRRWMDGLTVIATTPCSARPVSAATRGGRRRRRYPFRARDGIPSLRGTVGSGLGWRSGCVRR